ncbi:MAG: LutC/YkgG family protein [Thermogutta sp.]
MNSRDIILQRIRDNLGPRTAEAPPPIPVVWPRTELDRKSLAQRFVEELQAVHGEAILCSSWDAARQDFQRVVHDAGWKQGVVMDRPEAWRLASDILDFEVRRVSENPPPREIEPVPVSVLQADWLLADTGSSVVICNYPGERLACYLPPACVIVASADKLREHLPAAWEEMVALARQPERRGEFVIITGPSRTADIEKILILGVHGPKRLIVYVVGE